MCIFMNIPEGYILIKKQNLLKKSLVTWRWRQDLNLPVKLRSISHLWRSKGGRNDYGRRVLRTRGTRNLRMILPNLNYFYRFRTLSFVVKFHFIFSQNKFISLICLSNGGLFYMNSVQNQEFFSFNYCYSIKSPYHSEINYWFSMLLFIKFFSKISLIELIPTFGAQYIRANGVCGFLIKTDRLKGSAVIRLPSKVRKIFSLYSVASINPIMRAPKLKHNKAGFFKNLGFKSIVRGVAMNPVDHPHGGRTNTIKLPRTPWGKITKYK